METVNDFKRAYVKICTDNGAPSYDEKNGKDNFIIVTMMADGNLQNNWANLGVLCLFSLQNTCFASMTILCFDS